MKSLINRKMGILYLALIIGCLFNFTDSLTIAQQIKSEEVKSRKRALLIGISKYNQGQPNARRDLNTKLDIKLLNEVLIDHHKFAAEDVVILQDEKATKDNILSEMEKIVSQTNQGDVVFIYFAGHGDSIPDDNGDEIDGYDEALIPSDYVSTKDHSKDIRDDDIGKILTKLKLKKPRNVMVAFDSCFSGTATRGDFAGRGGGQEIIKPENESPSGLNDKNTSYPKEFVFLAAAAANPPQIAQETAAKETTAQEYLLSGQGEMGAFTYGLVTALEEATNQTTYKDLYERINSIVTTVRNGQQTPQIEGSLDQVLFDGTVVRQERFLSPNPVNNGLNTQIILPIGYLQGATIKSQFGLYKAGTRSPDDKNSKIAEGEIIKTEALTSILKLKSPLDSKTVKLSRAFETQHYYKDSTLKVILQNVDKLKYGNDLLTAFTKNNASNKLSASKVTNFDIADFSVSNNNENLQDRIYDIKIYPASEKEVTDKIVSADFRGLILERKDGSILDKIDENSDVIDSIKTALEREYRIRVVKGLKDYEDSGLGVKLNLIKVDYQRDEAGNPVSEEGKILCSNKKIGELQRTIGGQPEVKVNDCIMLEVENTGESDVYITILNLQADSTIAPGFPNRQYEKDNDYSPIDNYLPRGKRYSIPLPYVFRITEPIGDESYIVIATKEPTDFNPLITVNKSRDALDEKGANAFNSPLGKILMAATDGTRSPTKTSPPSSWAISTFSYKIKNK